MDCLCPEEKTGCVRLYGLHKVSFTGLWTLSYGPGFALAFYASPADLEPRYLQCPQNQQNHFNHQTHPSSKARAENVTGILGLYLFKRLTSPSQQPAVYLFWCFHRHVVDRPPCRMSRFDSSFLMRTAKEWNALHERVSR